MITGDGAYIKKINRQVILANIMKHGMISRADLSKITGLNKATISVQIADLIEEELVCETQLEHNSVGRRPIMLSINPQAGYVLGIDLDFKQIQYRLADLQGNPVHSSTLKLETFDYDETIESVINQINLYHSMSSNTRYGLVSVVIGIHGIVSKDEVLGFVTLHEWHNKHLKADLLKKLNLNIQIENNANLAAFAEKVYQYHECNYLISLQFTSGVGSGIIDNGKILKGFHGFTGEIGHVIVYPDGMPCKCGNRGCWGRYTSISNFISTIGTELNRPNFTISDLEKLVETDISSIKSIIERYICDISIGINNVINTFNPETLVLNSKILKIIPNSVDRIKENLTSSVNHYSTIELSELGEKSCVMGACALAIEKFLELPELSIKLENTR